MTPGTELLWKWERINLTESVASRAGGSEVFGIAAYTMYSLLAEKTVPINSSTSNAVLLRFNLSDNTFSVEFSAFIVLYDGSREAGRARADFVVVFFLCLFVCLFFLNMS